MQRFETIVDGPLLDPATGRFRPCVIFINEVEGRVEWSIRLVDSKQVLASEENCPLPFSDRAAIVERAERAASATLEKKASDPASAPSAD